MYWQREKDNEREREKERQKKTEEWCFKVGSEEDVMWKI